MIVEEKRELCTMVLLDDETRCCVIFDDASLHNDIKLDNNNDKSWKAFVH